MSEKYLILKGCAGLGNRLVTIFAAIQYAQKNNRQLVIDWTDGQFDKKGINAFDKCFDCNYPLTNISKIKNWNELTHSSELFKQNKNEGVYDLYEANQSAFFSKIPRRLFFFEALKKLQHRWQPIINGNYFNSLNYGSDLSNNKTYDVLYYVDFLPHTNYDELPKYINIKSFLQEKIDILSQQKNVSNTIGVHIRNTDKKPTSDVYNLIKHLKDKHEHQTIFLSTDSVQIEKIFIDEFNKKIILFPKTKPELKNEGLHQWALYNNAEDLKYVLYEESIMEMFLLSQCQYLFYQGNSTFSKISRVYHPNKNNCYDWLKL
ncbi:MAG: hypothetical protein KF900_12350 [Bacteroidetes bacterium]|nr:hypothetical protein [Bacteroidota bacterium]